MPGIFFNNVWMLAGLIALAVPVVIHLLLRRKKKRLRFSTVQFFLKQDEQSSQRRKLRNWLLLAIRLLVCALLAFAFARPYLDQRAAAGAGQRKRQVVLVLDRSLSMQAKSSDGLKWPRARDAARQILAELKPDDRAALVSCAARAEVLSEWAPAAAVSKLLNDLQPTSGSGSLGEGLQQAQRLLSFSDPKAAGTIYVISDLQRSGCQNLESFPVPEDAQLRVLKIGDLMTPNLAITDLQVEGREDIKPHAVVTSYSDDDSSNVKLDISIDGTVVASKVLALNAGASTNVELSLPNLKPGWHSVGAQIGVQDALAADNTRYQTLFVPEPARAFVVETRPGKRVYEEESFFVTTALDPTEASTDGAQSRFTFTKLSPDELATRLSASTSRRPCELVVLPGLKQVPSALGQALSSYVNNGGGLLLFVGEGVSANHYNATFRGLLPVPLGAVEPSAETDLGWRIGVYDTNTLIFGAFQLPNSGDLSLARFTKRFRLPAGDHAQVTARFEDGTPFVVSATVGHGRVILVNTSADTSWSDWPKHKTFVPWLHGTGHYLAQLAPQDQVRAQTSLVSGSDSELDLGATAAKTTLRLQPPAGREMTVTTDDRGQIRDLAWVTPGVFSLRDSSGNEVRRVAVNVPPQESDLTALSTTDVQEQVARLQAVPQTRLAAGLFGASGNQRELWRVLLLAVLILLFGEVLLANRTLA